VNVQARITGAVVAGDRRGRELGYPTANLETADALPAAGVYAAWVRIRPGAREFSSHDSSECVWREATVSVGDNPTFGDVSNERAECFIHDFSGDLYGRRLDVEFVAYIREMTAFTEIEQLIEHAGDDVRRSRALLMRHPQPAV